MKLIPLAVLPALCFASSLWAADPEMCLDCHEPAEDWEGMSSEEILTDAMDPSIKRHADNLELSQDQLKGMIAELLAK